MKRVNSISVSNLSLDQSVTIEKKKVRILENDGTSSIEANQSRWKSLINKFKDHPNVKLLEWEFLGLVKSYVKLF